MGTQPAPSTTPLRKLWQVSRRSHLLPRLLTTTRAARHHATNMSQEMASVITHSPRHKHEPGAGQRQHALVVVGWEEADALAVGHRPRHRAATHPHKRFPVLVLVGDLGSHRGQMGVQGTARSPGSNGVKCSGGRAGGRPSCARRSGSRGGARGWQGPPHAGGQQRQSGGARSACSPLNTSSGRVGGTPCAGGQQRQEESQGRRAGGSSWHQLGLCQLAGPAVDFLCRLMPPRASRPLPGLWQGREAKRHRTKQKERKKRSPSSHLMILPSKERKLQGRQAGRQAAGEAHASAGQLPGIGRLIGQGPQGPAPAAAAPPRKTPRPPLQPSATPPPLTSASPPLLPITPPPPHHPSSVSRGCCRLP